MTDRQDQATINECVERARRVEAKVSNLMKYLGLNPKRDTREADPRVAFNKAANWAIVSAPNITMGELEISLRNQGATGTVRVYSMGREWGNIELW